MNPKYQAAVFAGVGVALLLGFAAVGISVAALRKSSVASSESAELVASSVAGNSLGEARESSQLYDRIAAYRYCVYMSNDKIDALQGISSDYIIGTLAVSPKEEMVCISVTYGRYSCNKTDIILYGPDTSAPSSAVNRRAQNFYEPFIVARFPVSWPARDSISQSAKYSVDKCATVSAEKLYVIMTAPVDYFLVAFPSAVQENPACPTEIESDNSLRMRLYSRC